MSVETLILRVSSDSECSPSNSPVPDSAPSSAPFLAEEAYPVLLHSLMNTGLGDPISLSEDNIGDISSAASAALFTADSVFSQFLVVPRVEHAITVLLWRVRVTSTCAPGHSTLDLPTIPVHVLASSLSGLLDNTKLYKGTKQHPVPVRRPALHPHRLALPSPVTCSPVSTSPSPPRPVQTPMTPPDSVAGDSMPIPSGLPTPKRSVKFRPPPIITRGASGRGPKSAGAGPITLNFAAAALAEYHLEALDYTPPHDETPEDKAVPPSPSKLRPPSPSKLTHSRIPLSPSKLAAPQPPSRPASPSKLGRPRSRPPSPNPSRPSSPTKRLKKPPPGVKRSKSLTGKSKKSKDKEKEKQDASKWIEPTRPSSMWTPAGVEAHYRNDSNVRTLGLAGRIPPALGVGENGEVLNGRTSGVPTPSASALGTPVMSAVGTPTISALGTPTMSALGTPSASAAGTPSIGTPLLPGAVATPFERVEEPEAHISVEAPTPCASPKPSVRMSARSVEDASSREDSTVEEPRLSNRSFPSRENLAGGSRDYLIASGSREKLVLSGSRENLVSPSRENPTVSGENLNASRDELAPPRTPSRRASPEIHAPTPRTPTLVKRVSINSDPRTPSPTRSVFPGSSLNVLNSPDSRSVYSPDSRSVYSPDLLRSSDLIRSSDLLRSPASSMYRLSAMGSPSPGRDGSPVPRSILRNSFNGPLVHRATSPLGRATSPSPSTRSRTISVSGASLVRSRTVSGASLVRNRTVSSSESVRRTSVDMSRMRTISDLGRTSEESSIRAGSVRASLEGSRRASIESARRASIESAQRATMSSPRRTSLEGARRQSSMEKHRMSVDLDGITIMAVSIADATPVTPTPKRTAFNLDERDAYLTPPHPKPSPGAMSLGTGTPNHPFLSPGMLSHLSPGAMSLSTVPSLSPFPESDDGDFGFRDGEDEVTVTRVRRDASPSPVRRVNQGARRASQSQSPRRVDPSPRRADQSPVRAESPKPKRRPLPPPPQGSPTRNVAALRALAASPSLAGQSTPITGRGTPTRQLQGTPTKPHPGMPPRSWTDSPSRASTSTHQTLGVPMTQVSSRPRTLSTQARQAAENGVSESEAESLPFANSTSTLSLPGDVSLSEVSPFTAPKELESSSESERPSPWIGPGVMSSPWIGPRTSSSSSSSPWMGPTGIEMLGASGSLMNSSLPKLTESPRASVETSRPKSKHSASASGSMERSGSTANGSLTGHERAGSSSRPSSDLGHSRPGSTSGHSRTGSGTHPGLGLRAGQDILVPMLSSRTFSRSDVVRLIGRGDSFGSSHEEPTSPTRSSGLGTVSEYVQPMPVFMVPGADPTKVSTISRPKSMAHVDEAHASEDSGESVVLNQDGEAMVRTTEVGVGAGRARVQTGVGVGVSRARGGSVVKSKVDNGLRKRVDSGKSEPRARVNSATRPKIDSNLRGWTDSARRNPSSASQSPTVTSPATPSSASASSARRVLVRKASSEAPSRTRKSSNTSLRKSSMSSLRSTPPTTLSSPSARKSNRTTSISSGASTPRSTTPRSSGAFSPRSTSGGAHATPKAGTPRTSISSGRSSVTSPKSNLAKSNTAPPKTNSGAATPKATPRPLPPRPGPPPPVRPQRSALRPGLRTSVTVPLAPAQYSPSTTTTPTTPTRIRAVTMDIMSASPTESDPRPRRNTSISSKTPPVSRSGVPASSIPGPAVKSRSSNRNSVHAGTEQGSNDVPFPSPESKDSLQVPDTPRALRRSLSVSSAARKLVGRGRAASPTPATPPVDTNSLAHSTDASSIERSPQKGTRSLSRLAFSALLPKRGGNNAAAEAKVALAQAKAREVAEAKARAKAAAEEAKARAKAEAEEAKAARAAKAKEEKEAKKNSKRFGSLSRRGG
ncbi:unnamed protein product [Rhizoctonia solani]|uniref:Uncharacterized protein n=1 Tax=Rhizoctonia solani TaxID=456999 RepID=A0A8H3CJZ3_9AGAM|nr:unnamed protein product [Rhizoctonia solani]